FRLRENRHRRQGGGRADVGEQSEHPVLLDELLGVLHRELALVFVVPRAQLDAASVYASLGIHVIEVGLGADIHLYAQLRGRTGERRGLAEQNGFGSDTGYLGESAAEQRRGYRKNRKKPAHRYDESL